jgi:hypothetical protein
MSNSLFSEIDEAKKLAGRLAQRSAAVKRATKRRDNTLYRFFETLHRLDKHLRKIGRDAALEALEKRYRKELPTTTNPVSFLLELTYPTLSSKPRSKYAALLRYVREKKKSDQSIKEFVRANGGISRCGEGKRLREKTPKGWGAK